jgi:hypothetical protein
MGLITKNYIFLSIFASNIYFFDKTEGLTYLDLGYVVFWSCNPGVMSPRVFAMSKSQVSVVPPTLVIIQGSRLR